MNKNSFYAFMAAALVTASCTTNEVPNDAISQSVTIVADVSSQSRAPELGEDGSGTFTKGDVMTLCVENNPSLDYAYQEDGLTWGMLNPAGITGQIKLSACYPKQTVSQEGTFDFNTLTAVNGDLLLSAAQTVTVGTAEAIRLIFNHALHCLDLSFTAGDGYSADDLKSLTLSLNAKTTCVVDASQGVIKEVKSVKGDYNVTGTKASFCLVPQPTADVTLKITVGGEVKTMLLSDLLQQLGTSQHNLKGGAKSTITLKVGRDSIVVESGSIGAWEDQVTVDGELTIG